MPNDRPYVFEFDKIGSSVLGYISIAENSKLPFPVKRLYWTYYTPHEVIRGHHAHHQLQQIIVAVAGEIKINIEESTGAKTTFVLNRPNEGLYLPRLCWRTLEFSHTGVMLCLASAEFEETDYIRNYHEFKSIISNGK